MTPPPVLRVCLTFFSSAKRDGPFKRNSGTPFLLIFSPLSTCRFSFLAELFEVKARVAEVDVDSFFFLCCLPSVRWTVGVPIRRRSFLSPPPSHFLRRFSSFDATFFPRAFFFFSEWPPCHLGKKKSSYSLLFLRSPLFFTSICGIPSSCAQLLFSFWRGRRIFRHMVEKRPPFFPPSIGSVVFFFFDEGKARY